MVTEGNGHATTNEKRSLSFTSEGLDGANVARAFVEYIASSAGQALLPQTGTQPRPSKWLQDPTVIAVNDAFLLGWKIVELRTRIQIAADLVLAAQSATQARQDPGPYERELGDSFWLSSVWHATFGEIATRHFGAFPKGTTLHTFYEPAQGWKPLLPYLYGDAVDYADIGVPYTAASTGSSADTPAPDPAAFALYDVTRRAVNCLALLHVTPEPNTLLAESLRTYTDPLLAAIGAVSANSDVSHDGATRVTGIERLTLVVGQLLDAWDSFLRENYYAGGRIPDDATEATAYAAGSALAGLSWTLQQEIIKIRVQQENQVDTPYTVWQNVFGERQVSYIQHQLAALGTVLDDAYYRISGKPKPESSGGLPVPFNPELPSEVLRCISESINLWQKAVRWLKPNQVQVSATKQPTQSKFESVRDLLGVALVEQSTVWQSLIIGQQTMDAYNVETVMHKLVQTVIDRFQDEVRKGLWQEIGENVARTIVPVVAAVLALSIPGLLWLLIAHPGVAPNSLNANGLWAVLSVGPAIAALVGARSLVPARGAPTTNVATSTTETTASASGSKTSSASYLQGMISTIDSTLVAMLQAASTQLRLDLAALNHQVGVTYPLLDCFIESPSINSVQSDYQFMTEVIWDDTDRQDEIEGIVRAALGPLGLLVRTHIEETSSSATPAQGSSVVNVSVSDTAKQG
jgi:hypothetical protein